MAIATYRATRALAVGAAVIAGALLMGGTARANIVQNGNFGADYNLINSTCGGTIPDSTPAECNVSPTDWTAVPSAGANLEDPNAGDDVNGFIGPGGSLSQTLTTVAGATYSISFALAIDSDSYNDAFCDLFGAAFCGFDATTGMDAYAAIDDLLTVSFSPDSAGAQTYDAALSMIIENGAGIGTYVSFSYTDTALTDSTVLSFSGDAGNAGNWYLDDVSVDPVGVPEPGDLAMFLTAMVGWYSIRRRQRRN